MLGVPAMAQECNPVIDGTYCATEGVRRRDNSTSSGSKFGTIQGIQGIASDMTFSGDQPATLGAITFRGRETCMGLFRRGSCQ